MTKNRLWLLALVPISLFMVLACELEVPERTQDANFVKQTNEPNCGGFTTAYYQWLKQGVYNTGETERAFVGDVYRQITFGKSIEPPPANPIDEDALYDQTDFRTINYKAVGVGAGFIGLEKGANPARMMKYLQDTLGVTALFYLPASSQLTGLLPAIQSIDSALWTELASNVVYESIPNLQPFQYFISIYLVFNTTAHLTATPPQVDGLHYVLFHHNGERLVAYNPWDGAPKPAYYEQLIGTEPIVKGKILVPDGSGILLP
jgi:hypothetical protein